MSSVVVRLCNDSNAGTNDAVKMLFRNKENANCTTNVLDKAGDDFRAGSEGVYGLEFMDSCSWEFRAYALWFNRGMGPKLKSFRPAMFSPVCNAL